MNFLVISDFKAVCDDASLAVIHQTDNDNLARAEKYAIEEVSSYLRSRYDIAAAFLKQGDERNAQLVMITCDIALYHLIAWLPKRIGFEIRETRYNSALAWLKAVQAGKASPDIPVRSDETGADAGTPVTFGGWPKNEYMY